MISPGPGNPDGAGISLALIRRFHATTPSWASASGTRPSQAFGGTVSRAGKQMHARLRAFTTTRAASSRRCRRFEATRYHSLVVLERGFPADLEISARAEDGEIMGLRHRRFPVEGVQFHPESILTGQGKALLRNFLGLTRGAAVA